MATGDKALTVFAHLDGSWAPAGQLWINEAGERTRSASFAYGLRYLERPGAIEIDPVSLGIGNREAIRGQRLLPPPGLPLFGGIRDAAPDAWGRRVIEAKLRAPANSLPESAYLLHAGSQRVGALDIRESPTSSETPSSAPLNSLQYLLDAADRIEQGLSIPQNLEAIFVQGTSLGGARPKASIRDDAGVLWLAKFPSRDDRISVTEIEAATLRLAARCGLNVPPVRIVEVGPRKAMLIRRFDRYWLEPETNVPPDIELLELQPTATATERRLPFVSGLTMVACDEVDARNRTYADLASAIRRHAHPAVIRSDCRELFKRMVYNILVSNDDDHLRNHGFLHDPRLPGWRLSPLYDVMPRPSLAHERLLHLGVGPQGRHATLDNALAAHEAFTLSENDAALVIAEVWREVREWRVWFEGFSVPMAEIENIAPAFRHIDTVSTMTLRRRLP